MPNYKEFLSDNQFKIINELLENINGNYSITLTPGLEKLKSFGGIIINADVTWIKGKESTSYFTIKVLPLSKTLQSLFPIKACYVREIYFYTKVFPTFEIFQDEKKVLKPFKSYPLFYKPQIETLEMLVFKNLKKIGFKQRHREEPLDYNHIVIVIREYARLHALSLTMRDQRPKVFQELANNTHDHFFQNFDWEGLEIVCKHRMENALKSLDPVGDKSVYDKLLYYCKNMVPVMKRLINSINQYTVISRIDPGIPNFLFKYEDESDIPIEVSILDWQLSRLASPAVDLSTLIFSTSDKILRNHYNGLIIEYYRSLSTFLEELGSDAEELLPFNIFQNELKTFSILGLTSAIPKIYFYTDTSETIPYALNDDFDKEDCSITYELKDRSRFDQRVRDALIDFDKLDYNFW